MLSTATSQTPTPWETTEKRPWLEDSPSVTEVLAKKFKIYTKKARTNPKIDFLKGVGEAPIVLKGSHFHIFGYTYLDMPLFTYFNSYSSHFFSKL